MKLLLENWNKFLTEGGVPESVWPEEYLNQLEIDEGNNVSLFHVSSAPNIEILDPQIAVKNLQRYTNADYRAWDRPRVFYFTRCAQKDVSIGQIGGKCSYSVKIPLDQLYPIHKDPLNLGGKEGVEEYKKLPGKGDKKMSWGGIMVRPANWFDVVATLAEMRYNVKGFIYPQSPRDKENLNLIAILWTPEQVTKMDAEFYTNKKEEL